MSPKCYFSFLLLAVLVAFVTKQAMAQQVVSETTCTEVTNEAPTQDCRWKANMNRNVDHLILEGEVVAYKIKWFGGKWSGWFVSGLKDFDVKVNQYEDLTCGVPIYANSHRLMWSSFYDHYHSYIICK